VPAERPLAVRKAPRDPWWESKPMPQRLGSRDRPGMSQEFGKNENGPEKWTGPVHLGGLNAKRDLSRS